MGKEQHSHEAGSLNGQNSSPVDSYGSSQRAVDSVSASVKRKRKLKKAVNESPTAEERSELGSDIPVASGRGSEDSATVIESLPRPPKSHSIHASRKAEEDEILSEKGIPMIHFDAESGTIRYLKEDNREPEYVIECSYCGAVVQFDLDKCPICNRPFDAGDTGIVSLVADADFDSNSCDEMNCPSCGEHVSLIKGRCPACMETVRCTGEADPDSKVAPVIRADNVVFLHLDVESGELNYLQRLADRPGFEQLTVQLEDADHSELGKKQHSQAG